MIFGGNVVVEWQAGALWDMATIPRLLFQPAPALTPLGRSSQLDVYDISSKSLLSPEILLTSL